jgi:hypothetical protein
MSGFYHVKVGSLTDYEQLIAEIYINDQFVGRLSQEAGPEQTLLELAAAPGQRPVRLELGAFEKALAEAKQRLWDLRRMPAAE